MRPQRSLGSNDTSHVQGYMRRVQSEGPERNPAPLPGTHETQFSAVPKLGLSCMGQTLIYWCKPHGGHGGDWELEHSLSIRRLWVLALFSLGRDGFGGSYWHLQMPKRKENMEADFSENHSYRMTGNNSKLK